MEQKYSNQSILVEISFKRTETEEQFSVRSEPWPISLFCPNLPRLINLLAY